MKLDVREISKGVYWVGVKDWWRRLFDALIPLPYGTSYNAYLVIGDKNNALIDTVNPGFEDHLAAKINSIADFDSIGYVVMNHAEPDHAGGIPYVMRYAKKAMLVATEKGAKVAQVYYGVPSERIMIVREGDTIDLGGKTLKFIDAPWLHWPETMFTYLIENKVLFPCDFLGMHTAFGFWDDEVEQLPSLAKRYFGEIMMPFRKMGQKAIERIEKMEIDLIAPSHGPVHRHPQRMIEYYRKWTTGQTEKKALVIYTTMWNSTAAMVDTMVETLQANGVDVRLYNIANSDVGNIAEDLVDSSAIVLGAPTVLGGLHPIALYIAMLAKALRPPAKYAAVLSSYGWGGGAVKQAAEILEPTKIEIVGAIEINGPPTAADHEKIIHLAEDLSKKIMSGQ
ncbi:MAG: FprA family A-type flavoprotein [Methanomassiliicoccales archaeon]|jgi:flavorubredoxin|nr:FprA family A-type flavoprotein [Methanomassiliicoccales archaeon]